MNPHDMRDEDVIKDFMEKFRADFFWESEAWAGQTRRGAVALFIKQALSEKSKRIGAIDKLLNYVKMNSKDEVLLNLVREYENDR